MTVKFPYTNNRETREVEKEKVKKDSNICMSMLLSVTDIGTAKDVEKRYGFPPQKEQCSSSLVRLGR